MLDLPLGVVIELLVAALLVITIIYCVLLNHRLKRLRADEEGLRAIIAELLTATEIAERAIHGLKATSKEADGTIAKHVAAATALSDELSTKMNAADAIVQRIAKLATAGAAAGKVAAAASVSPAASSARSQVQGLVDKPGSNAPSVASQRLDDAARALQSRLQRAVS